MLNYKGGNINSERSTNIGIALCLIGVPLGMYFNFIFPFIPWSSFFMVLSVCLIASYKNFIKGKFPSFNKFFSFILLFQLMMLIYGSLSSKLTFQFASFHLYIISLIFVLSLNDNRINYDKIINATFYISCITTILGFYYLKSGIVTSSESWEFRQTDAYVLDPFTIAIGAIVNFVCTLFLITKKNKNKFFLYFFLTFLILDLLVIFMSEKRTPIFVTILILMLFLYKKITISEKMFFTYIKVILFLILILFCFYVFSENIRTALDEFTYNFFNGVLNILGNSDVVDSSGSAILRFRSRQWAYSYIDNNFNFFNYIFGAGYMTRWIDNPILQSYLDMGIFGFVFYFFSVLIFPIKYMFKKQNNLSLFMILLCLYNIASSYTSGHPYAYIKFTPIVLLAFVLNLKKYKFVTYSK